METNVGMTVALDADKFPELRGMTFRVTSPPTPDNRDATGRGFVELALTTDPSLTRAAYEGDLTQLEAHCSIQIVKDGDVTYCADGATQEVYGMLFCDWHADMVRTPHR